MERISLDFVSIIVLVFQKLGKNIHKTKRGKNEDFCRKIAGKTMTKKEKLTMTYLCKKCQKNKTYLISPQDITQALSKKFVLSVSEIDEIMVSLANQNFVDFVVSDSKNGYFYCVNLKKAGQTYLADAKKSRRTMGLLVLRSMFLATVSFVFGIILRAIFKS